MINITNLSSKNSGRTYVFSDLNLQFLQRQVSGNRKNNDISPGIDVVVDFDRQAVENSIYNILFQKRYLTEMDVNLKKYIGEPISEFRAIAIGETIERALYLYEPRITLEKLYIVPNIDQSTYFISMIVKFVNFNNSSVNLNASLTQNGSFTFINN
jgi:phage baseplate assembly protein W